MKGQLTLEFQFLFLFSLLLISVLFSSILFVRSQLDSQSSILFQTSSLDSSLLLYELSLLSSFSGSFFTAEDFSFWISISKARTYENGTTYERGGVFYDESSIAI